MAHLIWRGDQWKFELTKLETVYDIIHVKARTISKIRRKMVRDSVLSLSKLCSHGPHQPSHERQATFLPTPSQIYRLHPKEPIGRCIDFKTPACLCPSNIAAPPFVDYVPLSPNPVLPSSSPELPAYVHHYSLLSVLALLPPFRLLTLLRNPPPPLGSTAPPVAPSLVNLLSSIPPVGARLGLLRALALALI